MLQFFKTTLFMFLGILSFSVFAQKELYDNSRKAALQKLASEYDKKAEKDRKHAIEIAKKKGWVIDQINEDGSRRTLHSINEIGEPLYVATESNSAAANATRTNVLYNGGALGLNFNGSGRAVKDRLAIWDGGSLLTGHVEFAGRATNREASSVATSEHSTHVAGTMIATGVNPIARGMAWGANILSWDFSNDATEMTSAASNLLVSNHSYGLFAGWVFNASRSTEVKWEWWGSDAVSKNEDYKFGYYDATAQQYDRISYNAPYYLILKSAGNSRSQNGPITGLYYIRTTQDTSSFYPRARNDGYDILSTTSNAKNIMVVAAVNPLNEVPRSARDVSVSSFSSWGPTDDGRIKPDISGVGVNVYSPSNAGNTSYTTLSGTSMSTPNVSGSLLLLQEYYASLNDNQVMRSATLKGLALHTAFDVGNAGPDYIYGWGLLNVEKATEVIANKTREHLLTERELDQGQTFSQQIIATGRGPLRATICWTDPEGTQVAITPDALNNRTPMLVNDLDIRISDGTNTFLPFKLNPAKPAELAQTGDNIVDNVEQVLIPNPIPGRTYTITISHKGTLRNNKQAYSLAVSGMGGSAYCASAAQNDADARIDRVVLGSINNASTGGCATFTDFTNQALSVSVGQQIPIEVTAGTCGANTDKIVKIFADWNTDGDFDDANELIGTSSVINGTGVYRTNVTIPTGVTIGNNSRLRVICTETQSATDVRACGNFAKGETEDYVLRFARPASDLQIEALIRPDTLTFCPNVSQGLTVTLRNVGTDTQRNVPVRFRVRDNAGNTVYESTQTYSGAIESLEQVQVTDTRGFIPAADTEYTLSVTSQLGSDQDASNNELLIKRRVRAIPTFPSDAAALICGTSAQSVVALKATGKNGLFWYENPTGGDVLSGGIGTISKRTPNNTYYLGINDFSGSIGIKTKSEYGGGSYAGNFGPEPLITTRVPLVIESARLYIAASGTITFTVRRRSDNSEISRVELPVTSLRDPNAGVAANGQLNDDPKDLGAVYPLNLVIPNPGDYQISIEYDGGAAIFRTNRNPDGSAGDMIGYPYTIPNVMSITGALFQGGVIRTGYYYLYDIKVKSLDCPTPARKAVVASNTDIGTPVISPSASVRLCQGQTISLSSTQATGWTYQWQADGRDIANATNATYLARAGGRYTVRITQDGLCTNTSTPVQVTLNSVLAPLVSVSGTVLTSTPASAYQWLLDNKPITGATGQSLTATQSGAYQVQVTENGCSAVSDPASVSVVTSIQEEPFMGIGLNLSPNPASSLLTIQFRTERVVQSVQAQVYGVSGVPLKSMNLERKSNGLYTSTLDVSQLAKGVFFVKIVAGDEQVSKGFVKE